MKRGPEVLSVIRTDGQGLERYYRTLASTWGFLMVPERQERNWPNRSVHISSPKDTCQNVHGLTFWFPQTWNLFQGSLKIEWISQVWSVHSIRCYTAMRMNKLQLHAAKWTNLINDASSDSPCVQVPRMSLALGMLLANIYWMDGLILTLWDQWDRYRNFYWQMRNLRHREAKGIIQGHGEHSHWIRMPV